MNKERIIEIGVFVLGVYIFVNVAPYVISGAVFLGQHAGRLANKIAHGWKTPYILRVTDENGVVGEQRIWFSKKEIQEIEKASKLII